MPIKDTPLWKWGLFRNPCLCPLLACMRFIVYTNTLTILTPNTPNTNTFTNLTPRQETMSPAIAGARKFLFNSSDPNLDEKNVSISLRGNHQEQQFLSTCRPQHLEKHCIFCKALLGEDGIYMLHCLPCSSLLMF